MTTKTKPSRKRLIDFPSVVPVTSRELTGTALRHKTLLATLMKRYRALQKKTLRYHTEALEIEAAMRALNVNKKGDQNDG